MKRAASIVTAAAWALACVPAGAADAIEVEQLRQDVRELTRRVQEQARQIERLEREIGRLKARVAPRPGAVEGDVLQDEESVWLAAERWKALQPGMTEAEVIARLGRPTAVRGEASGRRTLLYALELSGARFLGGSVVLQNAKVTEIREPALR